MPGDILIHERRDGVAWLTMNRPEARNAAGEPARVSRVPRAAIEGAVAE